MSGLAYGKQLPAAGGEGEVASECLTVVGARDSDTVGGVGEHGHIREDVAYMAAEIARIDIVGRCAQAMDGQAATGWHFDDRSTGEGEVLLEITDHHDGVPSRCSSHVASDGRGCLSVKACQNPGNAVARVSSNASRSCGRWQLTDGQPA